MSKRLLLMRHAKSDWPEAIASDFERPLNARGRRTAPQMGGWMEREGLLPEVILGSSALRAQQTVAGLQAGWSAEPTLLPSRSLYLATPETIREVVCSDALEAETVLVVGHNPGMEQLVEQLGGQANGFPTAALAVFALPLMQWADWLPGTEAACVMVVHPKELARQGRFEVR
jgi:phosphohistidine phosphatase